MVKGMTTLASLSPSRTLKPAGKRPNRDMENPGEFIDTVEMWTGGWMEGVVSDDDAHLPIEEREKMLIPRITKAPFEPHINDKGDLKVYFDKGYVLLSEAPDEVKKAWKKALRRRLKGSSIHAPINPETWEKQQKAAKEARALEAEKAAQEAQVKAQVAKEKVEPDKDSQNSNG